MPDNQLLKKDLQKRLNSIKIQPNGLDCRYYDVSTKYFINEDETPLKRVDYNVTVELKTTHGIGKIVIDKQNINYNQHKPDLINEIISDSISKSVYPIITHCNEKGISSNEILNMEDIRSRWKTEKKILLKKYNSTDLNDLFQKFEKKLQNKISLERSLQYDWFWNLFFHPKLINYGDRRTIEKKNCTLNNPLFSTIYF
ncbi:MAG: hypothetical protein ACK5MD_09450 [Flavobacteriales bacterium]